MDSIAIDTIEEIQLLHDSGVAVSIKQHVREAAEANDVAFEGLYKAVRRNSAYESIRSREHGNRLLSDLEEALTVSSFITMDRMKRPLTRPGALVMMATMWKRTFSAQHLRGLLQRNKKFVRIKQGKVVTKGRTDPNNIRELEWFCDQFELVQQRHEITAKNLLNLDEIRVSISRDGVSAVNVISSNDRSGGNIAMTVDQTTLTLLPVVSAAGECLAVYIVVRKVMKEEERKSDAPTTIHVVGDEPPNRRVSRRRKHPWRYFYAVTATGNINSDLYLEIMKHYSTVWSTAHPGLHAFVLMDRLHAHTDPTTVAELAKRNVFTLLFNANASLYIQPLDGVVFSVLKRVFRANVRTYVLEDSMCDESDCSPVYHAAYDAMDKAFQKNVIIAAFRDRGIWPWRRDVVMKNALQWIKAARPSESVEERGQFIASVADAAVKLAHARTSARKASRRRSSVRTAKGKPVTWEQIKEEEDSKKDEQKEKVVTREAREQQRKVNKERKEQEKAERAQAAAEKRKERAACGGEGAC